MDKKVILDQEDKTISILKDFQKATVERIAYLFTHDQNRVLVADEVGLGKTLVAKGVIAKTASIRFQEGDDCFKTIYICSNQVIAKQNISKLNIFGVNTDYSSDTRLSMQHLVIWERKVTKQNGNNQFIQLIPLTPQTSFSLGSGQGTAGERALIYTILEEISEVKKTRLNTLFSRKVSDERWTYEKKLYKKRVKGCDKNSKGKYLKDLIGRIKKYDKTHKIITELNDYLVRNSAKQKGENDSAIISKLRQMFAEISVEMLEPDLIIMDEFQRFKFMLNAEANSGSDLGILVNKFFRNNNNLTRVLLLSATPYKLYSTLDEIEENGQTNDHYEEFFEVINFLFDSDKKQKKFKTIWEDYSNKLTEIKSGDTAILYAKNKAEEALYQSVCRTERIAVMENSDFIDDSSVKKSIEIHESDILSYMQMGKLAMETKQKLSFPVDYAKSCPYLMTFMNSYKLKEGIEKYFEENTAEIDKANHDLIWINKELINNYKALPPVNARLEELKANIFQNKAELLLWVPPSKPYYELSGVYEGSKNFSKILVFSSWEMVPKMIGCMVSYEAERRTVGKLVELSKNHKNTNYFAENKKRFPVPRLRFNVSKNAATGMSLFNLIYPSETLATLFDPIDASNSHLSLKQLKKQLESKLSEKLKNLNEYVSSDVSDREKRKWYYLAPMLLDGKAKALEWIKTVRDSFSQKDNRGFLDDEIEEGEIADSSEGNTLIKKHLDVLEKELQNLKLGNMPDDLVSVLVDQVLGSFAVCLYRTYKDKQIATELARTFINRFNTTENTAIVMLCYNDFSNDDESDDAYWKNVLKYCRDGNFQAMIDEYYELLYEGEKIGSSDSGIQTKVAEKMNRALSFHTVSYRVDTFSDLKNRIILKTKTETNMRSHFAVAFTKSKSDDSKNVRRKENLRDSFNSPMRPFILASTSVGQEGLDFHNYCRKIMHWNLPTNPIDLEQREGRINRFKCLAIRQNIAEMFADKTDFKKDVWSELWDAANKKAIEDAKREKRKKSDLIPYWCLGKDQKIKIERIIPMYPVSKDEVGYTRLIKILSLYRLTLGQARQEELLDYIFTEIDDEKERANLKKLFINL
ncbi:MAG: hypothetical protein HUK25_00710, partial [Treponema sp.]|nr:hypothetical protein [Treponema sp.]